LVSNVLFGQRKETVSISLDEIKDMPQKIISAYFKPVHTTAGVSYPLMQWYAFENKVDTWDKDALNKFNASIYSFKDEPIKAAELQIVCFSLQKITFPRKKEKQRYVRSDNRRYSW
ncbi:MAG: hypothetical protein J6Y38_04585, partial [Bacteroidaceae bacterium]|nr:hypothetical protein [Bacteroidaceae bacterium]